MMDVPGFVIVSEEGQEGEGTVHAAVTDKTGIQKLVTLSEVSSMQKELPTEAPLEPRPSPHKGADNSNKPKIPCDICKKSFISEKSLARHKKTIHSEDGNRQIKFDKNPPNRVVKDQMMASHIVNELQNLNSSRENRKSVTARTYHSCSACRKVFLTPSLLKRHFVVHTKQKPYRCDLCDKSYSQVEHLKRHKGTHTGENTFVCSVCQRRFFEKSRYTDHMMAHLEDSPYPCPICQKGFQHRIALKKHMRIHANKRDFKCEVCQKGFVDKQSLRMHLRTHTGDHPYKCQYCQKGFNREKLLRIHLRRHDKSRPFHCEMCLKRFTTKQGLMGHGKIHTRNQSRAVAPSESSIQESLTKTVNNNEDKVNFKCEFCSRTFERKCNLTIHQKALHSYPSSTENLLIHCAICSKVFQSVVEANIHMQSDHVINKDSISQTVTSEQSDKTAAAHILQEFSLQSVPDPGVTVASSHIHIAQALSEKPMFMSNTDHIMNSVLEQNKRFPPPHTISNSNCLSESHSANTLTTPTTVMSLISPATSTHDKGVNLTIESSYSLSGSEMVAEILNNSQPQPVSYVVETGVSSGQFNLSAANISFHDDQGVDNTFTDWSSELSKCPALSGQGQISWGEFSGDHPGQPANSHPGHPANNHPGHPANNHPGHPANNHPGHPANNHPGHPANNHPGHPANNHPGHPANNHPGHPANNHPGHPANNHSNQIANSLQSDWTTPACFHPTTTSNSFPMSQDDVQNAVTGSYTGGSDTSVTSISQTSVFSPSTPSSIILAPEQGDVTKTYSRCPVMSLDDTLPMGPSGDANISRCPVMSQSYIPSSEVAASSITNPSNCVNDIYSDQQNFPDRSNSFIPSDLLREQLPVKRKRRRSI